VQHYQQMPARRFPPPWSVEEPKTSFIVRDHNGQAARAGAADRNQRNEAIGASTAWDKVIPEKQRQPIRPLAAMVAKQPTKRTFVIGIT
jgi:hypothetical protein